MSEIWSNKYIKIPFTEFGRDENGCDCWGLVRLIYNKELNINLPTLLGYENIKDRKHISELFGDENKRWVKITIGEEKEFDVVGFNIMGLPTHVGIVVKKGFMLHCEKGCGTTFSNFTKDLQWKKRIEGIYRYE